LFSCAFAVKLIYKIRGGNKSKNGGAHKLDFLLPLGVKNSLFSTSKPQNARAFLAVAGLGCSTIKQERPNLVIINIIIAFAEDLFVL
jgi:hypothetical protein